MEWIKACLPAELLRRIQEQLGLEESLRLLWPMVVGAQLGNNTRVKALRGETLIVAVPDPSWLGSLRSMETMVLEAVNRFFGRDICRGVELAVDPRMSPPGKEKRSRGNRPAAALPAVSLAAETIEDRELREKFLESAGKYFAWQEVRRG